MKALGRNNNKEVNLIEEEKSGITDPNLNKKGNSFKQKFNLKNRINIF